MAYPKKHEVQQLAENLASLSFKSYDSVSPVVMTGYENRIAEFVTKVSGTKYLMKVTIEPFSSGDIEVCVAYQPNNDTLNASRRDMASFYQFSHELTDEERVISDVRQMAHNLSTIWKRTN